MPITQHKLERTILAALLLEYVWICLSGGGFTSLAHAPLFSIGVDPIYAFFYYLQIPQFITHYSLVCITLDILIIALMIYNFLSNRNTFFTFYFLLFTLSIHYITLTGYIGHRNFQSGYVWVMLPFLFTKENRRQFMWEALRYYVLFFYAGAALLKIYYGGIFDVNYFHNALLSQWLPYYAEGNGSFIFSVNQYLIKHSGFAYFLYIGGWFIELLPLVGFFTKKYDKIIFALLMLFHFFNWVLMDIAPIGQITFLLSFWLIKWNDDSNKIA